MSTGDFRVADISLADFGRKEIELAEHEVRKSSDTVGF
jgi:S-adenosylhomocysteine hydrolase